MSASIADYFQKLGGASSLVNTPKVTATRAAAGTTLTVDNCNWDTTTGKRFATFQVDTSGNVVANTEIIWKGIVTGTTSIGSLTRVAGASDTGNAIGDYVMLLPASDWGNQLVAGLLVSHNQDGTLISGVPLTTPKVTTSINDTNGNEVVRTPATASAVNDVTVANAATGNAPQISATGDDTNIDLKFAAKGTGKLKGVVDNLFNPYKFSVYRNSAMTSFNTPTAVPMDTKLFDTGTNVDVVTNKGRFTAPIAGFYYFTGYAGNTAAGSTAIATYLFKNGTKVKSGSYAGTGTTGGASSIVAGLVQLAATDYVEVYFIGGSGSTMGTGIDGCYFDGFLVSAT
jgi:hypothetical protein